MRQGAVGTVETLQGPGRILLHMAATGSSCSVQIGWNHKAGYKKALLRKWPKPVQGGFAADASGGISPTKSPSQAK